MAENTNISPAEIQKHLRGVEYPATKEDLLNAARENGAPEDILSSLENLDTEEFGGPQDVMKAYGNDM